MTRNPRVGRVPLPRAAPDEPYVIAMPVPNITGDLHIGHAMNLVVQDVFARHARRAGRTVVFPPGVDHAGLTGQLAAEQALRTRGENRRQLGRDGFHAYMRSWHDRHSQLLLHRMRSVGVSADWDRPVSSIDTQRQAVVREAFATLWRRGLVYHQDALVSWCTTCETCIPDQEIERVELVRTALLLRVEDDQGRGQTLATLRPHLLLAATAVQAPPGHPAREAATVHLPALDLTLPVTRSGGTRDRALGSHLSTVVPCYNADDFDIAGRAGAAVTNVFAPDGTLALPGTAYHGLSPEECDRQLVDRLTGAGALAATEPYPHGDARHTLCGGKVLPRVSPQWFVRVDGLKPHASWLLDNPVTRFNDPHWERRYRAVIEGVLAGGDRTDPWWEGACLAFVRGFASNQDWMISRQNWWGIPVPAWHCAGCRATVVSTEATAPWCAACGAAMVGSQDVLDVLVHSALWAACVTTDRSRAYHADLAVIGHDILEFWIPIANLLSRALFDTASIREVFVHGVIADSTGRKMSKSAGNAVVLDQLLAEHGTEPVRSLVLQLVARAASEESVRLQPQDPAGAAARVQRWRQRCASVTVRAGAAVVLDHRLAQLREEVDAALSDLDVGRAYQAVTGLLDGLPPVLNAPQVSAVASLVAPFHPELAGLIGAHAAG